jgi:hypothetical protein
MRGLSAGARTAVLWLGLAVAAAVPARAAWDMVGSKAVVAHLADGSSVQIGSVQFTPAADGQTRFELTMAHGPFSDHFLSMREFKCLAGPPELTCHVPYPYRQAGLVSPGRYAWLEHSLLFFFKRPTDFGAKLWNGIYFELRATDTGLQGTPQAIDLNLIASPPADLNTPPYRPALRSEMPEQARWLRSLSIGQPSPP